MKINRFITVILLVIMAGYSNSCEEISNENEAKGTLEISVALNEGTLKSSGWDSINYPDIDTVPGTNTFHILISVETRQGLPVMEDELIPLFNFGSGFVSKRIEFNTGEYRLTKFMVINPQGKVVFAAPMADSPKSYLVLNPLPMGFIINEASITRVVPEVLSVVNENPQEFGYAGFGFHVVRPLAFHVMAIIDNPRNTAPTQVTEALLKVLTPEGWQHSFRLEASLNKIEVRGGAKNYTLICEKAGFAPVKLSLSARELMASTPDNPIILRFGVSDLKHVVLSLQPDGDNGKDAILGKFFPDKNYGNIEDMHLYAGTIGGILAVNRVAIDFDITSIPSDAQIDSAFLSLYFNNTSLYGSEHSGDNTFVIQRITSNWEESSVTWNTQPTSSALHEVIVGGSVSPIQNFTGIDITVLIKEILNDKDNSFGLLLKLMSEKPYKMLLFASSDHKNEKLRPRLDVYYTIKE